MIDRRQAIIRASCGGRTLLELRMSGIEFKADRKHLKFTHAPVGPLLVL